MLNVLCIFTSKLNTSVFDKKSYYVIIHLCYVFSLQYIDKYLTKLSVQKSDQVPDMSMSAQTTYVNQKKFVKCELLEQDSC